MKVMTRISEEAHPVRARGQTSVNHTLEVTQESMKGVLKAADDRIDNQLG